MNATPDAEPVTVTVHGSLARDLRRKASRIGIRMDDGCAPQLVVVIGAMPASILTRPNQW